MSISINGDSTAGNNGVRTTAKSLTDFDGLLLDLKQALSELVKLVSSLGEDDVVADVAPEQKRQLASRLGVAQSSGAAGGSNSGKAVGGRAGPAGFLWKPISDSTGKLAILLPSGLTGKVRGVSILGPDSRVIEAGRNGGVGNGGREHFRFSKPGGTYPAGSIVAITLNDGSVQRIKIDRPGVRIEGK